MISRGYQSATAIHQLGPSMSNCNRRTFLRLGCAAGTIVLAPTRAFSEAEQPVASAATNVDPRSLIPPELLRPLDARLSKYGDRDVDATTLASFRRMDGDQSAQIKSRNVERRLIPGPAGGPDVPVFVINASNRGDRRPAILHIHGGGYVAGSAQAAASGLERITNELNCVAITVDYRLAPETAFPGSLEDNYAALRWLWNSAAQLGVDTKRIAVMGESAGGGHAAMLAIAVRDRGEFHLSAQVLTYPMLDDRTGSSRSVPAHIGTFIWTRHSNQFGWSSLLGQPAGASAVRYGSVPARVSDLSRLPPTFIATGSIDLFVEEDIDYARRLVIAAVPVELLVVPGAYHGFDIVAPDAPLTHRFQAAQLGALKRAFS
jgi:acetyl esterase/lipase